MILATVAVFCSRLSAGDSLKWQSFVADLVSAGNSVQWQLFVADLVSAVDSLQWQLFVAELVQETFYSGSRL
jgi:hypothetical protein